MGSKDTTLYRYDARTGEIMGEPLHGHEGTVYLVVLNADGKKIVSVHDANTVYLGRANQRKYRRATDRSWGFGYLHICKRG